MKAVSLFTPRNMMIAVGLYAVASMAKSAAKEEAINKAVDEAEKIAKGVIDIVAPPVLPPAPQPPEGGGATIGQNEGPRVVVPPQRGGGSPLPALPPAVDDGTVTVDPGEMSQSDLAEALSHVHASGIGGDEIFPGFHLLPRGYIVNDTPLDVDPSGRGRTLYPGSDCNGSELAFQSMGANKFPLILSGNMLDTMRISEAPPNCVDTGISPAKPEIKEPTIDEAEVEVLPPASQPFVEPEKSPKPVLEEAAQKKKTAAKKKAKAKEASAKSPAPAGSDLWRATKEIELEGWKDYEALWSKTQHDLQRKRKPYAEFLTNENNKNLTPDELDSMARFGFATDYATVNKIYQGMVEDSNNAEKEIIKARAEQRKIEDDLDVDFSGN